MFDGQKKEKIAQTIRKRLMYLKINIYFPSLISSRQIIYGIKLQNSAKISGSLWNQHRLVTKFESQDGKLVFRISIKPFSSDLRAFKYIFYAATNKKNFLADFKIIAKKCLTVLNCKFQNLNFMLLHDNRREISLSLIKCKKLLPYSENPGWAVPSQLSSISRMRPSSAMLIDA